MYLRWRLQSALCAAAVVLALELPARAANGPAELRFERILEVNIPIRIEITTEMGNITVRTGAPDAVQITGIVRVPPGRYANDAEARRRARALAAAPPIERQGQRIRIGHIRDRELRENVGVSYELVVPESTELRAVAGLGHYRVVGLARNVTVKTGAGNLELAGITGEVRAETGMGMVEIRDVTGPVRVRAAAGHIRAEGIPAGRWEFGTGLGDVVITVPAHASFSLHARSPLGHISSTHPLKLNGRKREGELHAEVRGGGPKLELATELGSIRVE